MDIITRLALLETSYHNRPLMTEETSEVNSFLWKVLNATEEDEQETNFSRLPIFRKIVSNQQLVQISEEVLIACSIIDLLDQEEVHYCLY